MPVKKSVIFTFLVLGFFSLLFSCFSNNENKFVKIIFLGYKKNSAALAVNDHGDVVGWAETESGEQHAFIWNELRGVQDLGTLGGRNSAALAVNDHGDVVGWAETASGEQRAFIWNELRGMQDLGAWGGRNSVALAVNDRGDAVGHGVNSAGHDFAWIFSERANFFKIIENHPSGAFDINNYGFVVGGSRIDGSQKGFFFHEDVGVMYLEKTSFAKKINDQGGVVGYAISGGLPKSFFWSERGGLIEFGNLIDQSNSPVALNNDNIVVGNVTDSDLPGGSRPFIWKLDGGICYLRLPVGCGGTASSLNNQGIIVGTIYCPLTFKEKVMEQVGMLWEYLLVTINKKNGKFRCAKDGQSFAAIWKYTPPTNDNE